MNYRVALTRLKITPVIGSGEPSVLEGVAKPKRDHWDIAVLRLKLGTSDLQIKSHLQAKGIEVKEVYIIPSKIKGTVSAKVRVALEHKNRALDAAIWPTHTSISSWITKSKSALKIDAATRLVAARS